MECDRCKTTVMNELNKLGLNYKTIEIGEVELKETISGEILQLMDIALKKAGLELINDKKSRLIEKIKVSVHQLIYSSDDLPKQNLSDYLIKNVNQDYNLLSNLFSRTMGVTIEKYFISQKVERIKELLVYEKLSLNDIVFKLKYSSVAHLSNQFKKVTGLTPTFFRQLRIINPHNS